MQDYKKLYVWQKAHRLTLDVYADSANYLAHRPAWELRGQVHGAAISIPSNIAEGSGRGSNSDFRRFCFYSLGSLNELEYDLLLAKDLRFLPVEMHDRRGEQLREVRRMLSRFAQTLEHFGLTRAFRVAVGNWLLGTGNWKLQRPHPEDVVYEGLRRSVSEKCGPRRP